MEARAAPLPEDIARRILRGEERALARLLSALEDGEPWSGAALRPAEERRLSKTRHDAPDRGGRRSWA